MAPHPEMTPDVRTLSPMAARSLELGKTLVKRVDDRYKNLASAGAQNPADVSGPGFQVLFALIGIGMVITALWFFFWAKNGGFKWRGKDDWEDYKSTVLRRKGPDGKTLSNATKSTRLGGGSVVHGGTYGAPTSVGYTDETATNADVRDAEEGKGGLRGGDGRRHKKHRRDYTNDYKDPELREYRNEKAARVGGLNRQADGAYTDYTGSQGGSELGSNVSGNPLIKKDAKDPKKEAKEKERRAKERMRKAKAAEKEAAKNAANEAKARKEAEKAEAKREKAEQKKMIKARGEATPSEAPEMAEVTHPLTEYAFTEYTAPSEYLGKSEAPAPRPAPKKNASTKGPSGPRRAPPSAAYSFVTGDDTNTVYTGAYTDDSRTEATGTAGKRLNTKRTTAPSEMNESSYYSDYRPKADPSLYTSNTKQDSRSRSARPSQDRASRPSQSQSRPRPSGSRPTSQGPRKQTQRSSRTAAPSDIFTTTNGDAHGHMSYPCHIPGLSTAGSVTADESVSQVGAPKPRGRDVMDGYRRGGARGRRDSLSDSD